MSSPIKVGIIGHGMSSKTFHIPLLISLPSEFKITQILSRHAPSSTIRIASGEDIPVVRSAEELYATDIDLAVITTENKTHFEYAKKALEAGKNVVVEKPFTATLAEAEDLAKLAESKGLVCAVFQNRRWDSDFLTLKKMIEAGTLGEVVNITSRFDRYRPKGKGGWRETDAISGGVFVDLGSHLVDQALTLFGAPTTIAATILNQRNLETVATDDYFDVRLTWADKPSLVVHLSAGMLVRAESARWVVHGTNGSWTKYGLDVQENQLKAGLTPASAPEFGVDEKHGEVDTEVGGVHVVGKAEGEKGAYVEFYKNVGNAIVGKAKLAVDAKQGLLTMKVLEACREAAKENKIVQFSA
ncbi:hypothetical protein YB2330_004815 [Saitoella coloradoensis]